MTRKSIFIIGTIIIGFGLGGVIASQTADKPQADSPSATPAGPQVAQTRAPDQKGASVADLIGPLAKRLADNPDDASSWVLLAKSYDYLNQPDKAAEAYKKAIEYGNVDPAVTSALVAAEAKFGGEISALDQSPKKPSAQTGFDAKSMIAMGNKLQDAFGLSIRGQVSVARELSGQIAPDHAVFIYAKETGGPAMPLAVVRATAAELPISFELDDSMSMIPGRTLSNAKQLTIVARISASGNANTQPGDLFVESEPIDPGSAGPVYLVINQVVSQ